MSGYLFEFVETLSVAVRLAGGDILTIATAGEPDCYRGSVFALFIYASAD